MQQLLNPFKAKEPAIGVPGLYDAVRYQHQPVALVAVSYTHLDVYKRQQGALLSAQAATASSALDGTVNFVPATLPGVATNLLGEAATGNTSALNVAIEQHP